MFYLQNLKSLPGSIALTVQKYWILYKTWGVVIVSNNTQRWKYKYSGPYSRACANTFKSCCQCLTLLFSLLLCVVGETGVGRGSFSFLSPLTADSCSGSVLVLKEEVVLGDRGDSALGLLVGEFLWADGQLCWFRHTEQRGLMGRQTCCPKPTSSQLISLHSSLQQSVRGTPQAYFKPALIGFLATWELWV